MTESIDHVYLSLKSRIAITRDARYAARKRLQRRNERAYYLISMLSLFVIVISVLPNVHNFSQIGVQWLLLITIVNSVFIIVTTLIDVGEDYSLNAYQMQQSARKLDDIFNAIVLASEKQQADRKWLADKHEEYQRICNEVPADHKDIDYIAVQVSKPYLFEYQWRNLSDKERAWRKRRNFWQLHYTRARWLVPHAIMVLVSLFLIVDIWDGESALLDQTNDTVTVEQVDEAVD